MSGRNMRTSSRWAFGTLAVLVLSTVVVGAPSAGSNPFSLPNAGSPPKDIWTGPSTTRAGARVKTTSGEVRVQATLAGVITNLGHVGPGIECVFEGKYDKITLVGVTTPAQGTYEMRSPTDDSGADRLVGTGSISFVPAGGSVAVYSSSEPLRRLITARASGGAVSLRSTRYGTDLVAIDDGDWSFALSGSTAAFFLAAAAAGTGTFEIQNAQGPCGPFAGTAVGKNGDSDAVSLDGACAVAVTLTNPGPATVQLTRQISGGSETSEDVAPGGTCTPMSGMLTRFSWTYTDVSPNRTTTVSLSATLQ